MPVGGRSQSRTVSVWPQANREKCRSGRRSTGNQEGVALGTTLRPHFTKWLASLACICGEQWFSNDTMTGYGLLAKPWSRMHWITLRALILPVSVWPCVTMGSPSLPSHTSISMQRTPMRKEMNGTVRVKGKMLKREKAGRGTQRAPV